MLALKALVHEALMEDIGQGDITTNLTVPENARCRARVHAKQDGVFSGAMVLRAVFDGLDAELAEWKCVSDGARFSKGDDIATFSGNTRAVLTGERVALNFVQHLSGIATLTASYMAAIAGLNVRVCDTRKTMPFLRHLEKKAVQHGGGFNHRFALFDGVLIKENHIVAAGGVTKAVQLAENGTHHLMKVGIEVTTLAELQEAVDAGAGAVLLDNMSLEEMRKAVELVQGRNVVLEASGNVNLSNIHAIAETGVRIISIGSITHSASAVDLSIEIEMSKGPARSRIWDPSSGRNVPGTREETAHANLLATPLSTSIVGSRVLIYESVESTNDRAFHVGGEGTVIVADRQTAGRGRHGRSWESPPGLGLWFSVAFENALQGLAFVAPLAVRDALRPLCDATIKWPNDILIAGKKCCGVLVESRRGATVLGIGINVCHHTEDFPPELREKATSVEAASGRPCDRGLLLRDVLTELDRRVIVLKERGPEPVWREWVDACAIIGRRVRCGDFSGVVTDVTTNGGLVIATEAGPKTILLGELVELDGN